jgi:hypothetical protein
MIWTLVAALIAWCLLPVPLAVAFGRRSRPVMPDPGGVSAPRPDPVKSASADELKERGRTDPRPPLAGPVQRVSRFDEQGAQNRDWYVHDASPEPVLSDPSARADIARGAFRMPEDGQHDLFTLIRTYAGTLQEQAATLRCLPGVLAEENNAEAEAYLAVVHDLTRILNGELQMSGLRCADPVRTRQSA